MDVKAYKDNFSVISASNQILIPTFATLNF